MRHFAERGYHATRIEDIATELSIAKGSVFQHFGSKEGLFLAAYKKAVASFAAYLDAPPAVIGPRVLRDAALLARAHRPPGARELDPLSRRSARQLRHRPAPAPGDQPLPAGQGPLRHGRLRAHGRRARRGPQRHRRGDDRLDDRVDGRALPGRAPDRGARPGSLLAAGQPPREDHRRASRSSSSCCGAPSGRASSPGSPGRRPRRRTRRDDRRIRVRDGPGRRGDDPVVLVRRSAGARARAGPDLREDLAARGPHRAGALARRLLHLHGRRRAARRHARRRRRHPRLLERLPAPRRPGRPRVRPPQGPHVRLPRLDLQPRRPAPQHARVGGRALLREGPAEPAGRARRDVGPVSLRLPRSRGAGARRSARLDPRRDEPPAARRT